jgi:hypothetical protein
MFEKLKNIPPDQLIIFAIMIGLIVFGTYVSYRPHRVPAATSSAPIIAPVYL